MAVSGNLVTRDYNNFRGVDFSNKEVALYRSPDALNVWKDYTNNLGKMIETRPSTELLKTFSDPVYGLFFYKVNTTEMLVVHSGTKLYSLLDLNKNSNLKDVDFTHNDIVLDSAISTTLYEWRFDAVGIVQKFRIQFDTVNSKKCMYIYREDAIANKDYLFGYWESNDELVYKYVDDIANVPSSVKSGMELTNYGDTYMDYKPLTGSSNLTPRNIPATALPVKLTSKTQIYTGLAPVRGTFFVYNNILYYKENTKYVQFNGTTCSDVVGYVPTTSISRTPAGGGTIYEDVNLLSTGRKNTFVGDGESLEYYLDAKPIDSVSSVKVNGTTMTSGTDYTVNTTDGKITFTTAPPEPDTVGRDNVEVVFVKAVSGYADMVLKCSIATPFDNRVFFSGDPNYPNVVRHSSLNDPTYISDLDYYNEGLDLSPVKALVPGDECLWVFKEPSQANTTVFYHEPSIDSSYGKIYPSVHSSISTGCVATGKNFNDDIVFFSNRGMEAITSSITGDKVLAHRSSLVDSKLLAEGNYESLQLEEWEGYLLTIVDNKVYLADSRAMFTNDDHNEYEWFYWELGITPTCTLVKDDVLYLGTSDGIYILDKIGGVSSYWTTPFDEFNYPQHQKTTNKKGSVVDMYGDEITVSVRTDNNNFETINTYTNTKGYVVCRIKKKKWKAIQLKYASTKPFGISEATLEAYVGSYVKR